MVPAEWVDHSSDRCGGSTARVIKVKHALDGTGLETVHERTGGVVEGEVIRTLFHSGSVKVDDLVLRLVATPTGLDSTDGDRLGGGSPRSRGSRSGRGEGSLGDMNAIACPDAQSQWNDLSDVGFGAIHLDGNTERLAQQAHGLETFLVVGATATDVNFNLVVDERCLELFESADDTLEGSGNVGEVGNTTANDQDLSLGVRLSASDEVKDGFGVFVCLTFSWCTRVFSIVGKLVSKAVGGDGIRVNNGSTTTSNHGPDTALRVQHSELQGSTGGTVEFLNVSFFLSQVTTEGGWPNLWVGRSDLGEIVDICATLGVP